MEKRLNIKQINSAMNELGFNQATISKKLEVSRAIVSDWLKGDKFPRPDKLLRLGTLLNLSFQELVEKNIIENEPVVAFRKKGSRKTKGVHLDQAKEMGQLLELLVPFIPFDRMFQPPALKTPRLEYRFIQKAALSIRRDIGIENGDSIRFEQLIQKINDFDVILIPVFHGDKQNHENALHIYLPASNTTWIYLNLDSNTHDFKFWMAHELGHVISPELRGDTAEDFADLFAQALLFPGDQAELTYAQLKKLRSGKSRLNLILNISKSLTISPVTVYKAVNSYAEENNLPEFDLEPHIFTTTAKLNKSYPNVSESLFKTTAASATDYVKMTKDVFHSPFFDILKMYLSENEKSAGFIQSILDSSLLDAKEIHAELVG